MAARTSIPDHGDEKRLSTINGAVVVSSDTETSSQESNNEAGELIYPTGLKRLTILLSMAIATFLVALDNAIISTAIPKITDDFKTLHDVGWYGSAYLFTLCAFQLFFGKLYTLFSIKWVFIASVIIFEVGSTICAAAPTSNALIAGRAIAGVGAAGNFSGLLVTVAHTLPLAKRPAYEGIVGAAWGVASVAGPLIGGALTSRASWRWCFWINLPIGAVVIVALVLAFKPPKHSSEVDSSRTWRQRLWGLDPLGTLVLLPCIVCCLLALQWGGVQYSWNSARIIVLFIISCLLFIAWIVIQAWMGAEATLPFSVVKQQSIIAGIWIELCLGAVLYTSVYYLPIWFQAIKGASPWKSGVMLIPLLVGMIITSIITGILVTVFGYYTPAMIASSVVMATGAGLLTTFRTSTGHAKWIGYQVLLGAGLGMGMQQPLIATQAVLKLSDIPIASSVLILMQSLGGCIFVAIANNVLDNRLTSELAKLPGTEPSDMVLAAGVTTLNFSPEVKTAYNHALTRTFCVTVSMAALSIVGSLALEWRSVKVKKDRSSTDNEEKEVANVTI